MEKPLLPEALETIKFLETPRLLLRHWQAEDLEDLYTYASVEGVGEMAGWPHHKSREESSVILELFMANPLELALILKETGHVIGSLGLLWAGQEEEEETQWEIGYALSKEHWGQGLMPEAVAEIMRDLFTETIVEVLWCGHFLGNYQSRRVIEKCGFHYWGSGTYQAKLLGKEFPNKKYRITKEEYWAATQGGQ